MAGVMLMSGNHAAAKEIPVNLKADVKQFEHLGDSVYVRLEIDYSKMALKSKQILSITPIIINGENKTGLKRMEIRGNASYKDFQRKRALMNKSQRSKCEGQSPYSVMNIKNDNNFIYYVQDILYEPWMDKAHIELINDQCGCPCSSSDNIEDVVLSNPLERERIAFHPFVAMLKPNVEKIKNREIEVECLLNFPVGSYSIRPDYMGNQKELDKIYSIVHKLKENSNIAVNKLNIIAFASPEGSLSNNKMLSEKRGNAMKTLLMENFDFTSNIFNVTFGGENWTGLSDTLSKSQLPYKDVALGIIKNTDKESAKKELINMNGGITFKDMVKNIFPNLRTVKCDISYQVRNFTEDELEKIYKESPNDMSINELWTLSQKYSSDSKEYSNVFVTVAHMFPQSDTANINAAAVSLERKDIISAEEYLKKINPESRTPEFLNNYGVLQMMKGNSDEAIKYFKQAEKCGLKQAKENIEQIH